jgi:hypothetical protein
MVRRRSCAVSNHEPRNSSFETPRKRAAPQDEEIRYSTSSGHGTMVDFTVFIAIASATARPMPSSENG